MSRIGKQPVVIPQGVKVQVESGLVRAEGPKGKLSQSIPSGLSVKVENNAVVLTREADHRQGPGPRRTAPGPGPQKAECGKAAVAAEARNLGRGQRAEKQGVDTPRATR